ncbi:MAG: DUF1801 domain-containing protein [Bacteroidetes bacterium]|nr:DUF1801 domain-containing protein [Bacteroidota bacterium]
MKHLQKINSFTHFFDLLPGNEKIIVDVLRQIILETLPQSCKEKLAYNVPYFYGSKRICLIWPASVPRGGIKKGVLLGFCYGYKLKDEDNYLIHGTNKQVYYKIFQSAEEIDEAAIKKLLKEAILLDGI